MASVPEFYDKDKQAVNYIPSPLVPNKELKLMNKTMPCVPTLMETVNETLEEKLNKKK